MTPNEIKTKSNNLPQIVRDRIAIGQSYKKIREEVGNPHHADYHYLHQRDWCDVSEMCIYINRDRPSVSSLGHNKNINNYKGI